MNRQNPLVLGTHNPKKRLELVALLAPLGIKVLTLDDFPDAMEIDETGTTFAENAALKACQQARRLRQWVLGEDSGLEVDALEGAPGVWSARFAGPDATDRQNNDKLIGALEGMPPERRWGRFVCHVTLSDPEGRKIFDAEAACRGRLRSAPLGEGGFGYDPLFEIVEYGRTFGQLGASVKGVLSHRARAMRQFRVWLASHPPAGDGGAEGTCGAQEEKKGKASWNECAGPPENESKVKLQGRIV